VVRRVVSAMGDSHVGSLPHHASFLVAPRLFPPKSLDFNILRGLAQEARNLLEGGDQNFKKSSRRVFNQLTSSVTLLLPAGLLL
jgi:hypothetical protein